MYGRMAMRPYEHGTNCVLMCAGAPPCARTIHGGNQQIALSEKHLTWNPAADLSEKQREQLSEYERLLVDMNQRVNLISRSDEQQAHLHHIIHSLALTYKSFPTGSTVVDWGTGGGLPGIPLAIRFPEVSFHLVDATRKKILAVRTMARRLRLKNVTTWHGRAEEWHGTADYAVSRATAPLDVLWQWYTRSRSTDRLSPPKNEWRRGLLCLKGGDLSEEIDGLRDRFPNAEVDLIPLQPLLGAPFFVEKCIVAVT